MKRLRSVTRTYSSAVLGAATTALLLSAACSDSTPVRLALDPDTLVLNSQRAALIPVRAIRADGSAIPKPSLSYVSNSPAVHAWKDGRVSCTKAGDAVVTIAARALAAHLVVRCRPNLMLMLSGWPFGDPLWVGGPPRELKLAATDSGRIVRMPRGAATARVRDDSVARIVGGRVYPLSRGQTLIELEYGGAHGAAPLQVVERTVHDSVRLVGSQMRSWRVRPGYYEMRLDRSGADARATGLELGAYRANCARAPRDDGQHYFCILKDESAIVVQNTQPAGARSERSGELTVLRLP